MAIRKIQGTNTSPNAVYVGLSTDDPKPTEGVANGDTFIEMDSGKVYFYDVESTDWLEFSGGSSIEVEELSVTENGTYTADEGKAYSPVTVAVPTSPGVKQGMGEISTALTTFSFPCSFTPRSVCVLFTNYSSYVGNSNYICAVYARYLHLPAYAEIMVIKCDGSYIYKANTGLITYANGTVTLNDPDSLGYTGVKYVGGIHYYTAVSNSTE